VLRLAQWLQRRRPGTSLGVAILLLTAPVTFLWNLVVEGAATAAGLWTYDPPIGPAIRWANGAHWPLMWPVLLMFGWINLIAWMVGPPEEQHQPNKIERLFGLAGRLAPSAAGDPTHGGARFQAVRLLVWIVFFNLTFALLLDVPLLAMRVLGGFNSPFLP
jgi:hypothetical protein